MLKEKIQQDLNTSLKEKKELVSLVLRQVLAAILNKEKEKRYKIQKGKEESAEEEGRLTEEEVLGVISSEAKKRKEAILEFERGSRQDLVNKEKQELEILKKYLPEQLPKEEIEKLAKKAIEKAGAKEIKDMGKVMAILMPEIKERAEGEQISKIVKELLLSCHQEKGK